jgi:hypothetical protein
MPGMLNRFDVEEMSPEDAEFIVRWAAVAGGTMAVLVAGGIIAGLLALLVF